MGNTPAIFEEHKIRRVYDEAAEIWWFSVVDVVQALIQQTDYQTARKYWNQLKVRLAKEGSQLVTSCHQLKMTAEDGKLRLSDAATAETLLRLVQSVPTTVLTEDLGDLPTGEFKRSLNLPNVASGIYFVLL
jgi:DNA-damage-inducible protein D